MRSYAWGPNPIELVSLEEEKTQWGCASAERGPMQETVRRWLSASQGERSQEKPNLQTP